MQQVRKLPQGVLLPANTLSLPMLNSWMFSRMKTTECFNKHYKLSQYLTNRISNKCRLDIVSGEIYHWHPLNASNRSRSVLDAQLFLWPQLLPHSSTACLICENQWRPDIKIYIGLHVKSLTLQSHCNNILIWPKTSSKPPPPIKNDAKILTVGGGGTELFKADGRRYD